MSRTETIIMKALLAPLAALVLAWTLNACKSGTATPASFCDTVCMKDTMRFINSDHELNPSIFISAKDCGAETLIWTYDGMGSQRSMGFKDLFGSNVHLNKDYVSCYIKDTSYAWLSFNDCSNGRGYLLKLPFSKSQKLSTRFGAINAFDPKFSVAPGLIAYSDRGNLFVEDVVTGKQDMMTFREKIEDLDYDAIHEYIDSVNVTPTRVWARVNLKAGWKELESKIELK